ncbi:hypothetical protein [Corynebacterium yonathiae]|uniref:Uncharacterized protein n=1 Tax=Corynebacterium yonathiae TaxID=2913504 RepID=A0A9X3LXE1_9CORY|nr:MULTISPECIES: hypothetical protein [Corynebacterium]MCZ9295712.1 hypothetical protein [Corynebacterium yonathiae]MDK2582256.1 hypothetical protein [Corynebacterium sp. BWA136]
MALENFAGPEHYTEFDPEKFIRDLKAQAEMKAEEDDKDNAGDADADSN